MKVVGRALRAVLAVSSARLGATCAGCRTVPVHRAGATCSPACWSVRHP